MRSRLLTILTLTACLIASSVVSAESSNAEPLANFPRSPLKIATPDARLHHFDVWIADSSARREQGLMFVKTLADEAGMLFIYPAPQPIAMWMKNTFIPLDMLFIRANGRVARVTANTTPHSLATVESGENVLAVLELKAGTAAKLNIRAGAVVMHAAFGTGQR
jgi:uncharacterized membrane protein (UPF0127 family)